MVFLSYKTLTTLKNHIRPNYNAKVPMHIKLMDKTYLLLRLGHFGKRAFVSPSLGNWD